MIDKQYKYFSISEILRSDTADKYKYNNVPTDKSIYDNIYKLLDFLDLFREYYGKPIIVSSGYRCQQLNKKVGGVKNSAHLLGYAADILPADGDFDFFAKSIYQYIKSNNVDFDQCIFEKSKTSRWIHISVDPKNRKQIFKLNIS